MTKDYTITGMTCKSCLAKVKTTINSFPSIQDVGLQLDYPQANITSEKSLCLEEINLALKKFGDYTITDAIQGRKAVSAPPLKGEDEFSEKVYKHLFAFATDHRIYIRNKRIDSISIYSFFTYALDAPFYGRLFSGFFIF